MSTDNLLEVHPAREELYEELHSRPSPLVETPCSITHIAVQISPNERGAEHGHLAELCAQFGTNPPSESASCVYQTFEGFELRWEMQTERPMPPISSSTSKNSHFGAVSTWFANALASSVKRRSPDCSG